MRRCASRELHFPLSRLRERVANAEGVRRERAWGVSKHPLPQAGGCPWSANKKAADRNPPPFTSEKCRRALVHISRARRGAIARRAMFRLPRHALRLR